MASNVLRILSASVILLALFANKSHAQELYVSPEKDVLKRLSDKPENVLDTDVIGDQVNYQTGALSFRQVDIDLPGQGPNITISRTFDVASTTAWNWRHDLAFAEWDMEVPSVTTNSTANDWKVVGSSPNSRCTQFGPAASVGSYTAHYWWRGAHLNIPGVGRQELMQRAPANNVIPTVAIGGVTQTFNIVTKNHWAVTCLAALKDGVAGEGFLAVSPQGTKYWFDKMVYHFEAYDFAGDVTYLYPGARWKASLLVTRIEDRHGNYLTYGYTGDKLTGITASDGRAIQIVWTANRGKPGNPTQIYHVDRIVSLPGTTLQRTWQYTYLNRGTAQGLNTHPRWDLRTLTLPDQSSWFFDIGTFPNSCVQNSDGCNWHYPNTITGSIRTPSGVTGSFKLSSDVPFRKGQFAASPPATPWASASLQLLELDPITFQSPFLREKTLTGPGVNQTWNYGYGAAVLQAGQLAFGRFAVKTPDNNLDLFFVDSAWGSPTEGQIVRKERYKGPVTGYVGSGPALRIETFEYSASPHRIGIVPRTNSNNLGEEYAWPVQKQTTYVDGATFNSKVNTFDYFSRPISTEKWSTGLSVNPIRTDAIAYEDNNGKWVLGQIKKETNLNTNVVITQTDYDPVTAMPLRSYGPGTTSVVGKLRESRTYNADGTVATVKDGNNNLTTFSSWKRGIPQSIHYSATADSPSGAARSLLVDDNGWINSVTNEAGSKTCYGYDGIGRISQITYPSETTTGVCDTSKWSATTLVFEPIGVAEYGIPASHWRQTVTTGNAKKISYYDALWRPLVTKELDAASGTTETLTKRFQRFAYDENGRVKFASYPGTADPLTSGTWTEYDALGRVTSLSQNSELTSASNPGGLLTTLTQYLPGFKTKVTNPRGLQTTTSYMAFDAPSYDLPVAISEPEGRDTAIGRDVFGKATVLDRGGNGVLATRRYVYDGYQQLCKTIEPEAGATVMDYDAAGNLQWSASGLTTLTNPLSCDTIAGRDSGRKVTRYYDARNRLTTLNFPDGNGDQNLIYWPDGLVRQITTFNDAGATSVVNAYDYNKRGLLTEESSAQPGWYAWGIGYGYDSNASLSTQTYPTGLIINYAPNALGQPTHVRDQSNYGYAEGVTYYPNGAIKQFTFGNGLMHNMAQNARQLPDRVTDGGNALDHQYAYDANGNPTGIYDYIVGAPTAQHRYLGYDGLDRLVAAGSAMFGGSDHYHYFTYDTLDNLKSWKHAGIKDYAEYVYANNRLTNIKNTGGATIVGMDYDPQGNLANKNGLIYSFDYGNRLRAISGKEGYRYDGYGRRVLNWRPLDGTITLSQYSQGGQLLYDHNTKTSLTTEHIYLAGSLLANRETSMATGAVTAKYQHTDALGSPVAVTNMTGAVIDRTNYEPYGTAINKPGYDGIGYTGHFQDGATGLTYMQQRYYDPIIGRFLSVDPVAADSTRGANFNRYRYASNNPYAFTDPDGRMDVPRNVNQAAAIARTQAALSAGERAAAKAVLDRSSINARATGSAGTGISVSKNIAGNSTDQVGWVPVGQGGYAGLTADIKVVDAALFEGAMDSPFSFELSGDAGAIVSLGGSISLDPGGQLEVTLSLGFGIGEHISFAPTLNVDVNKPPEIKSEQSADKE